MKQLSVENLQKYQNEYEKQIMNRLNCRIKWGIVNETASDADNHLITAEDSAPISGILPYAEAINSPVYKEADVLNNQFLPTYRFATLENDFWLMDGKMRIPEKNPQGEVIEKGEIGWVSQNICGSDGRFSAGTEPKLLIDFTDDENIAINLTGLFITFFAYRGEYATEFDIKVTRKDGSVVSINNLSADSYTCEASFGEEGDSGVMDIKKIELTVKSWNIPFHRVRIDEIEFGVYKYYDNSTLVDVEEVRVMNPVSSELPLSTLDITLLDHEMLFDTENRNSLTQYLTQRQPIEITWTQKTDDCDIEIPGGTYYLKEWHDRDSRREYRLVAEDLIGFTEEPYYKGLYIPENETIIREDGLNPKLVKDQIKILFKELFPIGSGLSDKLDVTDIPGDLSILAPLPLKLKNEQCTYKDCFMLLAQLAGCVITTDDKGKIIFKKLLSNYTQEPVSSTPEECKLPISVIYDNPPRSKLKSQLKEVIANYYNYNIDTKENVELFRGKITVKKGSEYNIEFEGGKITQIQYKNSSEILVDITDSFEFSNTNYTYYATLTYKGNMIDEFIDNDIEIIINGYRLKYSIGVYSSGIIGNNTSGEVVTIDNPICCTNAQSERITNSFLSETLHRDEFELEIKRNMLFECGDIVELEKPLWGEEGVAKIPCRILENKKSLTKVRQKVRLRKITLN